MTVTVRGMSEALGAEIIDADLVDADDATFEAVHRAFLDHCVVAIRGQDLTPEQHIAFSGRFGELEIHVLDQFLLSGHPEIFLVSNVKENGRFVGAEDAGRYWHSDLSYMEYPSLGSMLYAREIPPEGGDTLFVNMYAVYETLPDDIKLRIDGRQAVHRYGDNYQRMRDEGGKRGPLSSEQMAKIPDVKHPMVRTHPETSRKALFVNPGFTVGIVGMDDDEARPLLGELFKHSIKPEFTYRHKWQLHDVLFWDNRCTMHHATGYEPRFTRHMHRTTVKGDRPV